MRKKWMKVNKKRRMFAKLLRWAVRKIDPPIHAAFQEQSELFDKFCLTPQELALKQGWRRFEGV